MTVGVCVEDLKTVDGVSKHILLYIYLDYNGPVKCNHNISILYLYYDL